MARSWYVLSVFSGYENKVEKYLRLLMDDGSLSGALLDVKVPTEEVVEVNAGKKRTVTKRFLPGYILLEMDLPAKGWKVACAAITKIQGVTGFVGQSEGVRPSPISNDEARDIFQKTGGVKSEKSIRLKQEHHVGETVRIIDGPFEDFSGAIEDINPDKGKIRVAVSIFGRSTPVELDFTQIERV